MDANFVLSLLLYYLAYQVLNQQQAFLTHTTLLQVAVVQQIAGLAGGRGE